VAKEQYQQSVSESNRSEMRHVEPENSLLDQAEKPPTQKVVHKGNIRGEEKWPGSSTARQVWKLSERSDR